MSVTTKRALAASLKKLLKEKSLDSVTISDIAEDCGVNRQTFYYHFHDINSLVEWIYTDEATQALAGKKTSDSWEEGFLRIFEYVNENKEFVYKTYHSNSFQHLLNFLLEQTYNLLFGVIEEKAATLSVREDDKRFIADFYKFAFVGLLLDWIDKGMMEEPSRIIEKLDLLIQGDFQMALERFSSPL